MPQSVETFDPQAAIRAELLEGLLAEPAHIASKYFYDALGCKLFEAICQLPEYALTRNEAAIFAEHGAAMAQAIGPGSTLIDLGAGNCAKAAALFPLLHPSQYVPIDISQDFLLESVARLQPRFAHIEMTPLAQDFSEHLQLPATVRPEHRLFFYPGSSIGNFSPSQALALLRRMWALCQGSDGGVLIGIDLLKDKSVLEAAYDDALGLTAAFNLNLLRHVNRLAGTDFEVKQWLHRAQFNAHLGRVEMHLLAAEDVRLSWPGQQRFFMAGESIHTENSYKYSIEGFTDLLHRAGFDAQGRWTDADQGFALIYARASAG